MSIKINPIRANPKPVAISSLDPNVIPAVQARTKRDYPVIITKVAVVLTGFRCDGRTVATSQMTHCQFCFVEKKLGLTRFGDK